MSYIVIEISLCVLLNPADLCHDCCYVQVCGTCSPFPSHAQTLLSGTRVLLSCLSTLFRNQITSLISKWHQKGEKKKIKAV